MLSAIKRRGSASATRRGGNSAPARIAGEATRHAIATARATRARRPRRAATVTPHARRPVTATATRSASPASRTAAATAAATATRAPDRSTDRDSCSATGNHVRLESRHVPVPAMAASARARRPGAVPSDREAQARAYATGVLDFLAGFGIVNDGRKIRASLCNRVPLLRARKHIQGVRRCKRPPSPGLVTDETRQLTATRGCTSIWTRAPGWRGGCSTLGLGLPGGARWTCRGLMRGHGGR